MIYGDIGRDVIYAGPGSDWIDALAGDNQIDAGDGGNVVFAGSGRDRITTGSGADWIHSGGGADWVSAGAGNDVVYGGDGDDVLIGGTGDDQLFGGENQDVLWGGSEIVLRADLEGGGFAPDGITPLVLAGVSIAGDVGDGKDTLYGGGHTDWLFGGGDADQLFGDGGRDYVDGGAGDDPLFGGLGDDVLRGGAGNDDLHGNEGLDRLFGDDGDDYLYGDAGNGGDQQGQELWGGPGIDHLYAYAPSADVGVQSALIGDVLHGGPDDDWLYGNLRQEFLYGDEGSDTLYGDGLKGPNYANNPDAAYDGAGDSLFGGTGEDNLFGGGGNDVLWGGGDSDRLEGQNGADTLYGGSGIDILVLDVDWRYAENVDNEGRPVPETLDGHYGNAAQGDVGDDNATDILLVEGDHGTSVHDVIRIGQNASGQLRVEYTGRAEPLLVNWRDSQGEPLVEQFRLAGLMGQDYLAFVSGTDLVDISDLSTRSNDWVAVMDGGPENDILIGTGGRDRLDGGPGSDELYGLAGDDRLWGDSGDGDPANDHDILYGGQGHDDLIGGQGTNELYAWSQEPRAGGQFGVFVDMDGNLQENDGDLNDDGYLDRDQENSPIGPWRLAYSIEDTGYNRVLGGAGNDELYGGTGLDFLYGGGGNDTLYDRHGQRFEDADGALAGDEWKQYARSTNQVWYYSGSNTDDMITVDYVTEPGLLGLHHLITRLTNNHGNYTFDAQVELNPRALDASGKPIWNPQDVVIDLTTGEPVDQTRLAGLLPAEGDFSAIIIDALRGDDQITVGPTVQKSVWIDAGPGDDQVSILSGNAILVDQTEVNDSATAAYDLGALGQSTRFIGLTIDRPEDQDWYSFQLAAPAQAGDDLLVNSLSTDDGMTVQVLNAGGTALGQTDGSGRIDLHGLSLAAGTTYRLHVASNLIPTVYQLEFSLAGSTETADRDLSGNVPLVRRDVILGGVGDDVLAGGAGEEWIFGGPGNDVLTGGKDRQMSDLLWGEGGDDIFQVIPDALPLVNVPERWVQPGDSATMVPTLSDWFNGGTGEDQVLFLGGDLDANGQPVPDHMAVRWNTILHRYEMTSRVWNYERQEWAVEPLDSPAGTSDATAPQQYYAFFTTFDTEQMVIDTGAGDDEVRADPGYLVRGSQWGIDPGDRAQRATLADLVIRGSDGDDRLFGGAGDDTIQGGAGCDVIVGGGGNDRLDGGGDNDWITGGSTQTAPDRYEFSGRQANDTVAYAAVLAEDLTPLRKSSAGDLPQDVTIQDLNLHYGDAGDWYVLPTPEALKQFSGATAAQLVNQMLTLRFTDAQMQDFASPVRQRLAQYGYGHATGAPGRLLYLFAGQDTDPGDGLSVVPVEQYAGVPDYYLVHVVNINDFALVGSAPVTNPQFVHGTGATLVDAVFTLTLSYLDASGSATTTVSQQITVTGNATRTLNELVTAIQSKIDDATSQIKNLVRVGEVSQQDGRIGFWALQAGSRSLTITFAPTSTGGYANPAGVDLHFLSGQKFDLDHPESSAPSEALGGYTLTFKAPTDTAPGIGSTIAVSAADFAAAHLEASLQDRPAMVSLGDVNGDGYADFIGAVRDNGSQTLARVYFGSSSLDAAALGRYDFVLQVPAPVQAADASGAQTTFSSGDFSGDGVSDIVLGVSSATDQGAYVVLGRYDAFALVAGRALATGETVSPAEFQLQIDDSGTWVTVQLGQSDKDNLVDNLNAALAAAGLSSSVLADAPSGLGGKVRLVLRQGHALTITFADPAANPLVAMLGLRDGQGNAWSGGTASPLVVRTSYDLKIGGTGSTVAVGGVGNDLLVGDPTAGTSNAGKAYLFRGQTAWQSAGNLFSADFATASGSLFQEGFTLTVPSLWHTSSGRTAQTDGGSLYFGLSEGPNGGGTYDTGKTETGTATSPAIRLPSLAENASDLELSFRSFLATEHATATYDKARVLISTDQDFPTGNRLVLFSNQAEDNPVSSTALQDSTGNWQTAAISFSVAQLTAYRGQTVYLRFEFNTSDKWANNFEGWYVDDVTVRAKPVDLTIAGADQTYSYGVAGEGFGASVAGIGDYDGDGTGDFAILSTGGLAGGNGQIRVYSGATLGVAATITHTTPLTGYAVTGAGRVDGDAKDEFFVSSSSGVSYLVYGDTGSGTLEGLVVAGNAAAPAFLRGDVTAASNASPIVINSATHGLETGQRVLISGVAGNTAANGAWTVTRIEANTFSLNGSTGNGAYTTGGKWQLATGALVPLGDVDGDGRADLGRVAEMATDRLSENGQSLRHYVGQVYLGTSTVHASAGMTDLFLRPALQIETGRPLYAAALSPASYFFGPLGKVDSDGKADFAIADSLAGRQLHVLAGSALADNFVPALATVETGCDPKLCQC